MMDKTILIVGTYDTKNDELRFIEEVIRSQNGRALTMDVSVLKDPASPTDVSKHDVAAAADSSIQDAIAADDENAAMQIMSLGASRLAGTLHDQGKVDGVLLLGGSMGTDLALDVCLALPVGVPKYIVSTVAFSPMLPPDRLPADVQMILWAGGLYGLNSICKSSLSQAAGAVLGAARAVQKPDANKPMIGMTSFGKTVLNYMVALKPALEQQGFETAVFHATGMGGRAFEDLAAKGRFACVLDLATQEVGNHLFGSQITAGADRLTGAGAHGVPQIVAPGCCDLVDVIGWQMLDPQFATHASHAHNRLITSVVLAPEERAMVAKAICEKLAVAKGPTVFVLPVQGFHEWDRPGAPLCNPDGLDAFSASMRMHCPSNARLVELDCHINDALFTETVFDLAVDLAAG